jgi:hypothetical protein
MPRPRIRTVKPEMRQDERYGRMSRDARELFNGLITMADDEGRLRAMPAAILGHVFPYDDDAPRKLDRWLREVIASGMVIAYEVDGVAYLAFRRWRRHQQINRPRASELPPPPDPDVAAENAVPIRADTGNDHDSFTDNSVKDHVSVTDDDCAPAQARVPFRSLPSREEAEEAEPSRAHARRRLPDPDELPADFPANLAPHVDRVTATLTEIAEAKGANAVHRGRVARLVAARPRAPWLTELPRFADYWLYGDGRERPQRDVVQAWQNWVGKRGDLAAIERPAGAPKTLVGSGSMVDALNARPLA